jgi:hypothetical protein
LFLAIERKLLAAVTNAPTGVNRMAVTFAVIDDKDDLKRIRRVQLSS